MTGTPTPDEILHNKLAREAIELWEKSEVPARQAGRLPAAMHRHKEWAEVYDAALKICLAGGIVVLFGHRGTGKTQVGVELIRHYAARNRLVSKYIRASQIFMDLRAAYHPQPTITEKQAVELYTRPKLLVIDEAQERRHNDYENTNLTLINDIRYGAGRPTVYIANSQEKAFRTMMGESIWDRIAECGATFPCMWKSFRC